MFKPKQAKAKNAAAIPVGIPRPQPQTVIHNAPSDAAKIFAWAVVILVSVPIAWYFIVYLVEQMGDKKPERTAAFTLAGLACLLILSRLATPFLSAIRDLIVQIVEIKEDAKVEIARQGTMKAALPLPGESRLTREDSKFAALLRVVMEEAYRHLYEDGDEAQQYGYNEAKPWSRRANAGRIIPGFEQEPVTEQMASQVSTWLLDKGVIDKKGNVNVDRGYPSLAHFIILLEREYYTPIQVQSTLSPIIQRDGYNFIN